MKYLSVYKPHIISLPCYATVRQLQEALMKPLHTRLVSSISRKRDFAYMAHVPHKPSDIRLFRFTGRGSSVEIPEWIHEMNLMIKDPRKREEWIFWRVMHTLNSRGTDLQCGNELNEDDLIQFVLQFGPIGILDLHEGELFVYYDVCENLLDNHEQLYVNVIKDDEYQEITIQVDNHCTCKSVVTALNKMPVYYGYEKLCFCLEHGLIVREEDPTNFVRYGVKYHSVSQLCVQCIERQPFRNLKCYGYVIQRWKKDGRPEYSTQIIPRIFFVGNDDTYEWIQAYLTIVFHLEGERTILMYLSSFTPASAPRREWIVIDSKEEMIGDDPVEGLLDADQDKGLHSPMFCLYRPDSEQSDLLVSSLRISFVCSLSIFFMT